MKILGINIGHDSGATLVEDEKIVFAINEERLSRKKLHHGFPYLSIEEVLKTLSISLKEIDVVAIEGKSVTPQDEIGFELEDSDWKKLWLERLGLTKFFLGTELGLSFVRLLLKPSVKRKHNEIKKFFIEKGFEGKFEFIDHHLCHAASAYYTQKENNGIAITLDASGEGYCSRVYKCEDGKMQLLNSLPCYHSPAYYYAYITKIAEFTPLRHEGKITGLAAFGSSKETLPILKQMIDFDAETGQIKNSGGYHIKAIKTLKKNLQKFSREDISAGVQDLVEDIVTKYVAHQIKKYFNQKENVFLAGGLFANVKLNQRIKELDCVKNIYIFPNMGDGGVNAGAALCSFFSKNNSAKRHDFNSVYFAKKYTSDEIKEAVENSGLQFVFSENITELSVEKILEKKVVGRFNEAMEYGPRALCNRSIIYSASDKSVNQWLNNRLKRTEFMPFAPVVRDVDFKDYFIADYDDLRAFQFMTITCHVTEKCIQEAPAIVHVDNTARPQLVTKEINPSMYDILTHYKEKTGVGVLVNTSFNMHEEPIVNTPKEAIETFLSGKLDVLSIGNYLIENGE